MIRITWLIGILIILGTIGIIIAFIFAVSEVQSARDYAKENDRELKELTESIRRERLIHSFLLWDVREHKVSVTNCPNCGAPYTGEEVCEYCGTIFRKET